MGWRIYFWVLAALYGFGVLFVFGAGPTAIDLVDVLISALALTGLYGYVFQKRVFSRDFWTKWPLFPAWDFLYNVVLTGILGLGIQPDEDVSGGEQFWLTLVLFLFLLPLYLALFRYATRSPDVWGTRGPFDR